MNAPLPRTPRRWLQFRLRTLLLLVTLVAAALGWRMHVWRTEQAQQRQAVAKLKVLGASTSVTFDTHAEAIALQGRKADNVIYFNSPQTTDDDLKVLENAPLTRGLYLAGTQISDAGLFHLRDLKQLKELDLKKNKRITDAGLVHLEGLKDLDLLILIGTGVTPAGVKKLKQKLPNTKIAF